MYEIGKILNDRYEVTGVLERVAIGQLYRAIVRKGGSHVFLWVLGQDFLPDSGWRQKFIQDMTRVYGVRHPNSLPLVDLFTERANAVMALAYVEGPTLGVHVERRLADHLPPTRGEAWGAFSDVASAVSQFHQLNLLVGAIRPEAVLVTASGIKLFDLGVGMMVPRKLFLKAMKRAGRWSWIAPELRQGWPADRRADVYALAGLAHLIFYGAPHGWHDGVDRGLFAKMGRRLRFGARPPVGNERWPLVDEVLQRALAAHPHRRPGDVEIFCREVERALAQSPERRVPTVAPPEPKSASARTMSMPAAGPDSLPPPPSAPPAITTQPTMAQPLPAPVAPAPTMQVDAPLVAPMPALGQESTREIDANEIAKLLAQDPNRTREVNTAEIEALLAQSREEDPDKK